MELCCSSCPRHCGEVRNDETGFGFCRFGLAPVISRVSLHMWEEPCISGTNGAGTIFFSGCSLRCVYCQNSKISREGYGKRVSIERLSEIFAEIEDLGAHNIELVTPSHFSYAILCAAELYKPRIPIVWNSSGYDDVDTLRSLHGKVQIYLPDFKYMDSALSERFSSASDYFPVAWRAIEEMYSQVGPAVLDEHGIMQSGMIVRHLVLPGHVGKSIELLRFLKKNLPQGVYVSVMAQYTPCANACEYAELNRRLTKREYGRISEELEFLGFEHGYFQDISSANEEYIPSFDLTGVEKRI